MASQQQIAANQKNAQLSTGPVSEAGRERSSKNSTVHGFTGKTLFIPDEEKEPYEAHVASYYAEYKPVGPKQTHLLHQLADLHWSLHQISVDQSSVMSLIGSLNAQARQQQQDPLVTLDNLAKATRTLNNLGTYEGRKRRAAKATQEELLALQKADEERLASDLQKAAGLYKTYKAQGKAFDPAEFGFVCSIEDLDDYFRGQQAAAAVSSYQSRIPQNVLDNLDPQLRNTLSELQAENEQIDAEIAATMQEFKRMHNS